MGMYKQLVVRNPTFEELTESKIPEGAYANTGFALDKLDWTQ